MPDLVVAHITSLAAMEGFTRGIDPDVGPLETDTDDRDMQLAAPLPDMMAIGSRDGAVQLADHNAIAPDAGVYDDEVVRNCEQLNDQSDGMNDDMHSNDGDPAIVLEYPPALALIPTPSQTQYLPAKRHGRGVDSLQSLQNYRSESSSAFTISVTAALRDRRDEATPVIMAELKQMLDKHVFHGVHTNDLTKTQRSAIIRSSMFLKDKYLASGAFEKYKARLVAGGNQQDRGLYKDLSSPTVATSSLLAITAIAAAEGRKVIAIGIGVHFFTQIWRPLESSSTRSGRAANRYQLHCMWTTSW